MNNINISTNFANKKIKITKMKSPFFKLDENGLPSTVGYLCFSLQKGLNSFEEIYTNCTTKVLQEVINKKLYTAKNVAITLIFDDKSKVVDMEIASDIKTETPYGFSLDAEQKRQMEAEILELGSKIPSSKEELQDCIFKTLTEPNEDGAWAEIKFIPKHANKQVVANILQAVSEMVKNKKVIAPRDIILDTYMVSSVNNNGEYIYISPNKI